MKSVGNQATNNRVTDSRTILSAPVNRVQLQPEHRLWHYVWKLLSISWRISFKTFLRARRWRQIGMIVLLLFGLALDVGIFLASWFILGFIRSPQLERFVDASQFLPVVPTMILTGAFTITLLFSFGLLLQGLYLAGDMEFLLSAPVPIRAVFIAKLLQAILPNALLVSLFALPLLFGLGASSGYSVFYYPLVALLLVLTMLAGAGLSSLLVMGIVRIFPARTVAEVMGAVGGLLAFTLSQLGNLSNRFRVGPRQLSQGLQTLTNLNTPWSPFAWAGRGLVDIGTGSWLSGAGLVLLACILSGGIFIVAWTTAERLYFTGWTRLQSSTRKNKIARHRVAAGPSSVGASPRLPISIFPPAVRGLIIKDSLVLRRDLRNMSQLISPLILGLIWAATFIGRGGESPFGSSDTPLVFQSIGKLLVTYGSTVLAIFVGWMLMSRLALMAFSQEGRQYWILKSAPVSVNQLLIAKFIVAVIPTLVLGWAFLLILSVLQRTAEALWFDLPVVALITAGGAAIYLAFGVSGANLAWENPRRMVSTATGCVSTVVGGAYVLIAAALFFLPPVAFALLGWSETIGQLIGLASGGVMTIACTIVPLVLVRAQVSRVGEA